MRTLPELLEALATRHTRVCPRQVLGVRMGLAAGRLLSLALPRRDRRLFVVAETDGSFADALTEVTGCGVGSRMMRIEDHGKVAATFVDVETQEALRIVPHPEARIAAAEYAPHAPSSWQAQFEGYALMPDERLLRWRRVTLATPVAVLLGSQGRAACPECGEEILNQRLYDRGGRALCRACAGDAYYRDLAPMADGAIAAIPAP